MNAFPNVLHRHEVKISERVFHLWRDVNLVCRLTRIQYFNYALVNISGFFFNNYYEMLVTEIPSYDVTLVSKLTHRNIETVGLIYVTKTHST